MVSRGDSWMIVVGDIWGCLSWHFKWGADCNPQHHCPTEAWHSLKLKAKASENRQIQLIYTRGLTWNPRIHPSSKGKISSNRFYLKLCRGKLPSKGINISHLGKFGKSSSKCHSFWGGYVSSLEGYPFPPAEVIHSHLRVAADDDCGWLSPSGTIGGRSVKNVPSLKFADFGYPKLLEIHGAVLYIVYWHQTGSLPLYIYIAKHFV